MHQIMWECGPGIERLALPVGVEALHHLVDLVRVRGGHRVVAGLGQVLRLPVERLNEGRVIVYHHRLLVGYFEGRIAVDYVDPGIGQQGPRLIVLLFAATPGRIQHDPDLHAAPLGGDHAMQQLRVGKQKHLDAQRLLGVIDRVEDRAGQNRRAEQRGNAT